MTVKRESGSLFDLTGKVAVVTGAGSGLGRAMAQAMAESGASVACVDVNAETAEASSEELKKLDVDSAHLVCDVSDEQQVRHAFKSIVARWGRMDILFNNAGISGQNVNLVDVTLQEWNRVIGINLTGAFLCAKEAVKVMSEQKSGKIINTGSIWSFRGGYPTLMVPPYHATKGALISLTKEMALECAKEGINVNVIVPGFFATNISSRAQDPEFQSDISSSIPLGRVGMPDDIKGTALFLASEASDYLTGAVIVVDGGYMCR